MAVKREPTTIDPVIFLEKLGISSFSINYEGLIVYLPEVEFKRVAWQVGMNIASTAKAFNAFGWKWQKVEGNKNAS